MTRPSALAAPVEVRIMFTAAARAAQVLVGTVLQLLVRRVGVDRRHQAVTDAGLPMPLDSITTSTQRSAQGRTAGSGSASTSPGRHPKTESVSRLYAALSVQRQVLPKPVMATHTDTFSFDRHPNRRSGLGRHQPQMASAHIGPTPHGGTCVLLRRDCGELRTRKRGLR